MCRNPQKVLYQTYIIVFTVLSTCLLAHLYCDKSPNLDSWIPLDSYSRGPIQFLRPFTVVMNIVQDCQSARKSPWHDILARDHGLFSENVQLEDWLRGTPGDALPDDFFSKGMTYIELRPLAYNCLFPKVCILLLSLTVAPCSILCE